MIPGNELLGEMSIDIHDKVTLDFPEVISPCRFMNREYLHFSTDPLVARIKSIERKPNSDIFLSESADLIDYSKNTELNSKTLKPLNPEIHKP